jgi:hypothetical protein
MADLHPLIIQAKADGKPEILLIEFYFAQGTIYVCDQPFDFDWGGNTYIGSGILLKTEKIKSTVALSALKKKYDLSGADISIVAAVVGAPQTNREVIERRVYLDTDLTNGYSIISDPVLEWQGIITDITASSNPAKPSVVISTGTILSDFDRRVNRSTTTASQQAHFPLDTGMRYASEVNKEVKWGIK